jgi:hypothetical protein
MDCTASQWSAKVESISNSMVGGSDTGRSPMLAGMINHYTHGDDDCKRPDAYSSQSRRAHCI